MGRKNQLLTCTFYVGGKPVEKLTEEQLDAMARRLGEAMSIYYTAHPDEYIKLCKGEKENEQNHHPLQADARRRSVRRCQSHARGGEHPAADVP